MTLEQLLTLLKESGYRLSHLGESGPQWFASVAKGSEPRINRGRGNTWGDTPANAIEKAFEEAKKNAEAISSGKYTTATAAQKISGDEQVASIIDELFGDGQ
jgi:hypothetical protein